MNISCPKTRRTWTQAIPPDGLHVRLQDLKLKKPPHIPTCISYFEHAVLRPDEESAACQEIRSLEIRFWYSALQSPHASKVFLDGLREQCPAVPPDVLTASEDDIRALIRFDVDRHFLRETARLVVEAKEPRNRAWQKKVAGLAKEAERKTNEFVSHNFRLVAAYCKKYVDKSGEFSGMSAADVMQEGCLGLLRAIHRFDPTRNLRFSTYATHWIRATIGRSLSDHSRIVRVPVHLLEAAQAAKVKIRRHFVKTGERMTAEELSKTGSRSVRRSNDVLRFLDMDSPVLYLEQGNTSEGPSFGAISLDQFASGDLTPEDELLAAERRKVLGHLTVLPPLESLILRWRLGLESEELNMREIGEELNVSRERVRQLYEKAILKLKDIVPNPDAPDDAGEEDDEDEDEDLAGDDIDEDDIDDDDDDDADDDDADEEDIEIDSDDLEYLEEDADSNDSNDVDPPPKSDSFRVSPKPLLSVIR